jgi:hypothetical protein
MLSFLKSLLGLPKSNGIPRPLQRRADTDLVRVNPPMEDTELPSLRDRQEGGTAEPYFRTMELMQTAISARRYADAAR